MQLHPGDEPEAYPPEKIKEILKNYGVIGFDIWEEPLKEAGLDYLIDKPFTEWSEKELSKAVEAAKNKGTISTFSIIHPFVNEMKPGDIVLVRRGNTPIALVEVKSDYFMDNSKGEDEEPWFRHRRKVKILGFFDEDKNRLALSFNEFPQARGTLQRLTNSETRSYKFIKEWFRKLIMEHYRQQIKKALEHQKQVILQGPPGSGKTFLAKQISEEILINPIPTKVWNSFLRYINGKKLKTKQEAEFEVQITDRNSIKAVNKSITITEESFQKFLNKCYQDIENCSLEPGESYHWSVAKEFIKWFRENYFNKLVKLIQFHPSYTYEDFVRGIQIDIENGHPKYKAVNKIFAELCEEALKNPELKYILIIDEINRANLPVVLGELIYALEYRGEPVETPYEVNGNRTLIVPENLYIIGTMNTADRSIGHIDYAVRRRFFFIPVWANKELIENDKARELYEKTIEEIFKKDNLSPEFQDKVEDVKIGHTYFLGDEERVAYKFVYQVIPLLVEYIQDGILKGEEVVDEVFKSFFREGKNWRTLTVEDVLNKLKS